MGGGAVQQFHKRLANVRRPPNLYTLPYTPMCAWNVPHCMFFNNFFEKQKTRSPQTPFYCIRPSASHILLSPEWLDVQLGLHLARIPVISVPMMSDSRESLLT